MCNKHTIKTLTTIYNTVFYKECKVANKDGGHLKIFIKNGNILCIIYLRVYIMFDATESSSAIPWLGGRGFC